MYNVYTETETHAHMKICLYLQVISCISEAESLNLEIPGHNSLGYVGVLFYSLYFCLPSNFNI